MRFELGPHTNDLRVFLRDGTEITDEFRTEDFLLFFESGRPTPTTVQLSLRPEHVSILAGRVEVQLLPPLTPKKRRSLRRCVGEWLTRQ